MAMHSNVVRTCGVTILAAVMLASAAPLLVAREQARAEPLSTQQIIDGLKNPRTRGLAAAQDDNSVARRALIERVRHQVRSLSLGDREQMAEFREARPRIDLDINFEYDSAILTEMAEPQLHALGQALTRPDLAGSVFMLSGHTDAKGGEEYNQSLSERRAEVVKKFLIMNYRIPAAIILTAGYGKRDLRSRDAPFAPENRRVEVVNISSKQEASR